MDGIAARDARVLAILTAPDEYFTRARLAAWAKAGDDVAQDLARRAKQRQNGASNARHGSSHGSRQGSGGAR
jgi:hypothetical protein